MAEVNDTDRILYRYGLSISSDEIHTYIDGTHASFSASELEGVERDRRPVMGIFLFGLAGILFGTLGELNSAEWMILPAGLAGAGIHSWLRARYDILITGPSVGRRRVATDLSRKQADAILLALRSVLDLSQ